MATNEKAAEVMGTSDGSQIDQLGSEIGNIDNPSAGAEQGTWSGKSFALFPYQMDAIASLDREIAAGRRSLLLVLPTGSGKTVVAAAVIRRAVDAGERVLFLAHRVELIKQASKKLLAAGVEHGIIQAGMPTRPGERVQVASVQTIFARAVRTKVLEMPAANLVIVDEAHHAKARTYVRILDDYPDAVVIGLTATPCRADGRGLGADV